MTKNTFDIETFAANCKAAMAGSSDRRAAAKAFLAKTLRENAAEDIIAVLQAAIPAGASIGEMIVHASPELTMLYARAPARFRSGIHNHTVFACIGQLVGAEKNTVYRQEGNGLVVDYTTTVQAGEVFELPEDAIHNIENPNEEVGHALHIYGGDFGALMEERSLWSHDDHTEMSFSFPALLAESVSAMKQDGNAVGLDAIAKAIPAARALVEA